MREHPHVYEINARVWLAELGVDSLRDVPNDQLERLSRFGFDYVWLMGVWRGGSKSRARALAHEGLRREYDAALPGWREEDVGPSPYAVAGYEVADELGGSAALAHLRARLAEHGIGLLLDFVPNHLGLDHPWAESHPERFVRDAAGRPVHGRDPFFPPWDDTLQLDYRRPETRAAMVDELRRIAEQCDGVRCDMAMLVLRDVFARTWGEGWQGGELWPEAIAATRPGFLFVAEAYWELEYRLMQLGFDYVYDKRLYDRLVQGDATAVRDHLCAEAPFQRRLVRFVENHDEPRAAAAWSTERHEAAATVAATVPGMRLFHQGQLEGRRRKLPVQLRRGGSEPVDAGLVAFYQRLLAAAPRGGDWRLLPTEPPVLAWTWDAGRGRQSLVVVNLGDAPRSARVEAGLPGWETWPGDLALGPWEARLLDLR